MSISHEAAAHLLAKTPATRKGRRPRKAPRARRAPEPIDDIADLPIGPRVVLSFPPVECSPNSRDKWARIKAGRKYRDACAWATIAAGLRAPTDGPIDLHVAYFPPDRGARDDDNIVGSFKSGRDGVAIGMKVDDNRFRIKPEFRPEPRCCVVVTLLSAPSPEEVAP